MREPFLLLAGSLSTLAGLLHLAIMVGGPDWYRFFGAGERVARNAALGSPLPPLMAISIAALLFVWAAYAFSGAGLIGRLPLLKLGLVAITAVYLVRGLAPLAIMATGRPVSAFWWISSAIVLLFGLAYLAGT